MDGSGRADARTRENPMTDDSGMYAGVAAAAVATASATVECSGW